MGAATCISSDKTGTLTKNPMSVVAAHVRGAEISRAPEIDDLSHEDLEMFADIASIDSTEFLERTPEGVEQYMGNPTECGCSRWSTAGASTGKKRRAEAEIVHQFGFTSDRERMSMLVSQGDDHLLLAKGALEVLIERAVGLTDDEREDLLDRVKSYSDRGHRTPGLAYRRFAHEVKDDDPELLERSLSLLSLVAIADPCVRRCAKRSAGAWRPAWRSRSSPATTRSRHGRSASRSISSRSGRW